MSRPLIGLACLCDQCGGREALLTSPPAAVLEPAALPHPRAGSATWRWRRPPKR
jgi:hypothetical protein